MSRSFDHMTWQAQLDLLHAQANVKAREAASLLIKGEEAALSQALAAAQEYAELERQIERHMNTPPNRGHA